MTWQFDRTGNHLAVDFANTVSKRYTDRPIERLPSYADLVEFARQTELVSGAEARRLLELAEKHPGRAQSVHHSAVALREALYRTYAAVAEERAPDEDDLATVNAYVTRLEVGPDLDWHFRADPYGLDAFLGPVVRAAVELLTTEARRRVHVCEAPDCLFLFYDGSKNQSRRWCDMKQCGNRMKARRHYRRAKT